MNAVATILGLSGGELVLIAVVALVLFSANKIPRLLRPLLGDDRSSGFAAGRGIGAGLGKPVADALTHSNETVEFQDPPALRPREIANKMKGSFILWIAQGFGSGRAPFAPGTFGSLVGLAWFAVLLVPGSFGVYIVGTLAGAAVSVWVCGRAEQILNQKDPGSVVMDEIAAIPLCFFSIVWMAAGPPGPGDLIRNGGPIGWVTTLIVFALFRFFDVVKPWPVKQSQKLPGGWGVTVDDLLAAVYVNVVVLILHAVKLV